MTRFSRCLLPGLLLVLLLSGCGGKEPSVLETGGINANDLIVHLMDRTTRIVGSVTSVPTAEAALPELQQVSEDFDKLIKEADRLSPGARADLAEQAARYMPGLKDNTRRISAWKGVGDVLGPTMTELVQKLAVLQ
jgi:hypothetical protein